MMEVQYTFSWCFINLLFCLTLFPTNAAEEHPTFATYVANYENGKTKLEELQDRSVNPTYGQCWSNALNHLYRGCKQLSEEEQGRMALSFTTCFLKMADYHIYNCTRNENLTMCLKKISGDFIAFNAYTEFFTHTLNMCFFLESQMWYERTENTISRLTKSSKAVAELLESNSKLQEEMMHKHDILLAQQAKFMEILQPLEVILYWFKIIMFCNAGLVVLVVLAVCRYCCRC